MPFSAPRIRPWRPFPSSDSQWLQRQWVQRPRGGSAPLDRPGPSLTPRPRRSPARHSAQRALLRAGGAAGEQWLRRADGSNGSNASFASNAGAIDFNGSNASFASNAGAIDFLGDAAAAAAAPGPAWAPPALAERLSAAARTPARTPVRPRPAPPPSVLIGHAASLTPY